MPVEWSSTATCSSTTGPTSQNGFAILFTVRNQDGGAPWSVVEDIVFANNVVRRVGSGINILGHDDNNTSRQTSRISVSATTCSWT